MRLGIVERLHADLGKASLLSESLRVAASLAADEEWNLAQFELGIRLPGSIVARALLRSRRRRFGDERCTMAEVRGRRGIRELEVVAEHAEQVFFKAHHQRVNPGVEDDVRSFESHLGRIARRKILHVHR